MSPRRFAIALFFGLLCLYGPATAKSAPKHELTLQVEARLDGTIRLSWKPTSQPLVLERKSAASLVFSALDTLSGTGGYVDSTALPNDEILYRLRLVNAHYLRDYGVPATVSPAAAVPPAPVLLRVALASVEVHVPDWTDQADYISIERRIGGVFREVGRLTGGQTSFRDRGLPCNRSQYYRIRYATHAGSGAPSSVDSILLSLPAPSALEAVLINDHSVRLRWSADSLLKYTCEIEKQSPAGVQRFSVPPGVTAWTDSALGYDAITVYRARAIGGGDTSAYSNTVNARFVLRPVSGLAVDPVHDMRVHLSWTADAVPAAFYLLERSPDSLHFTPLRRLSASDTMCIDTLVDRGHTYYYRLATQASAGTEVHSGVIMETIPLIHADMVRVSGDSTVPEFFMDVAEVNAAQFLDYCRAVNREPPASPGYPGHPDYWEPLNPLPAVNVSWWDAVRYCNWRSMNIGLTPVYDAHGARIAGANGYHLPDQAQYFAARRMAAAMTAEDKQTVSRSDAPIAIPDTVFNAGKIWFLKGNVWEWTETAVEHKGRTVLGGAYCTPPVESDDLPEFCFLPDHQSPSLGFRCVLDAP